MNPPAPLDETAAWNRAHDRLLRFLKTFALDDHVHVSRLALELLDQARALHQKDPSRDPVRVTMEEMHRLLLDWLAKNLHEEHETPAKVMTSGCVALLLSKLPEQAPASFLKTPLPEPVQRAMKQTLLATGPDLNVSSMTPRHLDYGPMLGLARQTWHRLNIKELIIALCFWAMVYVALYFWLSGDMP